MRLVSFSIETLVGVFVGLLVGLVEMSWEFRSFGVLIASGLAIHIAKRLDAEIWAKIIVAVVAIGILVLGTARPIWTSFHADFPEATSEIVLSRIILFGALATCCFAGYVFVVRPLGREGYRVFPAQLIAFGISMIGVGLLTALAGLGWQFQQNWAAGIKPSGAPTFTLVPPQITQSPPLQALPPPQKQISQTPFFSDYNLTESGVSALADELYKARDILGKRVELDRMSTDGSAGGFIGNFGRACDRAGVDCPIGNVHPNSPDEKGIMIYVIDPSRPPESAQELRRILRKIGIDVPFVARPGFGPTTFSLFVAPRPE
jgi:hypothetical protein